MNFGEKIKQTRKEKGLSQEEFGKKTGIHPKNVGKYEANKSIPSTEKLKRIAEVLEVSADYLIFDNVPKSGKAELSDLELFSKFREVEEMEESEKNVIVKIIDAMIIKTKVEKAVKPETQDPWDNKMRKILTRFRDRAKKYSEEDIIKIVDKAVEAVRDEEKEKVA